MDEVRGTERAGRVLAEARVISAEFLYQPRPTEPRARAVFDFCLRSRLAELTGEDGVLLCAADEDTLHSVQSLLDEYPAPRQAALIVNPLPLERALNTPSDFGWETPERWTLYQTTDRWARILAACRVASKSGGWGWLALPALDAVWGQGLLDWLIARSEGLDPSRLAAVSPVTPSQHSAVPGVRVPPVIVDALNIAFGRDDTLPRRLADGSAQGVWGKMCLLPRDACAVIVQGSETDAWEDDREMDRVLREAGWTTRGLWVMRPELYRQSPPVFDRAGLKTVIDRTLHYSLHIPAAVPAGTSILAQPGPHFSHEDSIWYHDARRLADALTAECLDEIGARVARYGASWVDWGAYRYVARPGNPSVEVWRKSATG